MDSSHKKRGIMLLEMLLLAVIVFFTSFFDAFHDVDLRCRDNVYQVPRGINNKIKIISIDDKSLQCYGAYGNWSRSVYADVVNALGDSPAVIAFDIMMFDEMDEDGDKAFAEACEKNGRVVCGSFLSYSAALEYDSEGNGYINEFHIDDLRNSIFSDSCTTGFVNVAPDDDAIVRSALLTTTMPEESGGNTVNSFAQQTYLTYCEKMGITPNIATLDSTERMWINYAGKPGDYEHISLCDVADGTVDPRVFTDCIVFVGAYETGLKDQFPVPNSSDIMYGVEIHANIVQGLLDGRYSVPANRLITALIAVLIVVLAYCISRKLLLRFSTPIIIVMLAGYVAIGMALSGKGTIIPVIYVPVFIGLGYLFNVGRHYSELILEKHKITNAFKKYVAPQVVEEIAKSGKYHIKLGGENRHIAVLFVDIRGFTPMSESLEPEQVVDILNSYLNLTTNSIFNNGGTLDKFIGDATMAVFNAPFDLDDYIFRAVKTAWDIIKGADAIENAFLEKYGKSVSFGVGVNCGNAVVGNIGCDCRMDYTAIGDTVNTAARLEANAKRRQVLISQAVYEEIKDRIAVEPIGEIPLKGKSKGIFVYSLTGIEGE